MPAGHPDATEPTCDAREAGIWSGECRLVTGQGSDIDIIWGRKTQICDVRPVLSDVRRGAGPQVYRFFPVSSADLHLKACVGTGRAGPLENQSWLFGDHFTVERGHWGRICKASITQHEILGLLRLQTLNLGEQKPGPSIMRGQTRGRGWPWIGHYWTTWPWVSHPTALSLSCRTVWGWHTGCQSPN